MALWARMLHAAALLAALFLAGCGTRVETEVTSFHTLPQSPAGKSFVMIPYKNQEGSLEWQAYAGLVSRQLEKRGLVRAQRASDADLAVFMAYAIDSGRTTVSAAPVFGQTGGGTTTTTTGFVGRTPVSATSYTPATYGVTGYVPVEDTVYGRALKLVIVDVKRSLAADKPEVVYQGTATSVGSSGNLNVVMPAIIAGTFKDWPGRSGSTSRHAMPLEGE